MKKLILLVLLISGCSKDNNLKNTEGDRLISIEIESETSKWLESLYYDSEGFLENVERSSPKNWSILYAYENQTLKQRLTHRKDDNLLIWRDSITYDSNGKMNFIYNYSLNFSFLKFAFRYDYTYDDSDKLTEIKRYSFVSEKYTKKECFTRIMITSKELKKLMTKEILSMSISISTIMKKTICRTFHIILMIPLAAVKTI